MNNLTDKDFLAKRVLMPRELPEDFKDELKSKLKKEGSYTPFTSGCIEFSINIYKELVKQYGVEASK